MHNVQTIHTNNAHCTYDNTIIIYLFGHRISIQEMDFDSMLQLNTYVHVHNIIQACTNVYLLFIGINANYFVLKNREEFVKRHSNWHGDGGAYTKI